MSLQPIYTPRRIEARAYQLRYAWTGWPSVGLFPDRPPIELFNVVDPLWETDGIRRLEVNWTNEQIAITCSVKPTVSPTYFVSRIKGRLQHALQVAGYSTGFSRKVSFRTVGDSKRAQVEAYIAKQVPKEQFVDERFTAFMSGFTKSHSNVRLDQATETNSGRYWYNLHLVLVTDLRARFTDSASLNRLAGTCDKVANKKGYAISVRSVMPDHIHISLRGTIASSPEDIALSFMSNIAYAFGQQAILKPSYYVGSFGEYDMGSIRSWA